MGNNKFIEENGIDSYALSVFYFKEQEIYTESKVYIKLADLKVAVDTSLFKFEQFDHETGTKHLSYCGEYGDVKSKLQVDTENVDLILTYMDDIFLSFESMNTNNFKVSYNVRGMRFTIAENDIPEYLARVCTYIKMVYTMTWDSRFMGGESE